MNEHPVGRPSAIRDSRKMRRILTMIERGVPATRAAAAVGVSDTSWGRWMKDARTAERKREEGLTLNEGEEMFRGFRELVQRAEARFEAVAIAAVMELAFRKKAPTVILEVLRRHPASRERWNVPDRLEVLGPAADEPPDSSPEYMTRELERLRRIAAERVQRAGAQPAEGEPA